eukprot:9574773-Alexandrium_andersonii.AAC.1
MGPRVETARGQPLDEDARICALDQLLPDDFRRALGDKLELQTFAERALFVKRRLWLEKHRALAQEATVGGAS